MSLLKYQSLIRDTIAYLENLKKSKIAISSDNFDFFQQCLKFQKKIKQDPFHKKKPKFNVHIENKRAEPIKKTEIRPPKLEIKQTIKTEEIKQPPKTEEKKPKVEPKEFIKLQPLESSTSDLSDIKKALLKISPDISFVEQSLDDKKAKLISQRYIFKTKAAPITIIAYKEDEKSYKFLQRLAKAIDIYFYPAILISAYPIEKDDNWKMFLSQDHLKLTIASDFTIYELPNLRKLYKQFPNTSTHTLNDKPLFILPDITLYLKEPLLKPSLFKTLKQKISEINE